MTEPEARRSLDRDAGTQAAHGAGAAAQEKARESPAGPLFHTGAGCTPFWQARFYDFNVWTTKKRVEKLQYMHRNPVKRGLVALPELWRWSSYRFYLLDEAGAGA